MARPPSISIARCIAQARAMRASALTSESASDKVRFAHMADAYDSLAAKIAREAGRLRSP